MFVCIGNSCRSPMAEGLARALGGGLIEPVSAGTAPASGVSRGAMHAMARAGVDISAHRPRALDYGEASSCDLVVLMGEELRGMFPEALGIPTENWGVADPFGGVEDDYIAARDLIRDRVLELVSRASRDGIPSRAGRAAGGRGAGGGRVRSEETAADGGESAAGTQRGGGAG